MQLQPTYVILTVFFFCLLRQKTKKINDPIVLSRFDKVTHFDVFGLS
jgi:hypothetical protein